MQKHFNEFEEIIKRLDTKIKYEDYKDLDNTSKNIGDMRTLLTSLSKKLDDMDRERGELSPPSQKQYISKLKSFKSDYEVRKTQINRIDEKVTQQKNLQKLAGGNEFTKNEAKEIERDAIKDLHKNTDYQKDLLIDINKDIIVTNNNLGEITTEVKAQDDQIHRIHDAVLDTGASVKRTDKNINAMRSRNVCVKVLLHILAILIFIAIVVVFIIKIVKKVK